jgi:hypothetical protein
MPIIRAATARPLVELVSRQLVQPADMMAPALCRPHPGHGLFPARIHAQASSSVYTSAGAR